MKYTSTKDEPFLEQRFSGKNLGKGQHFHVKALKNVEITVKFYTKGIVGTNMVILMKLMILNMNIMIKLKL